MVKSISIKKSLYFLFAMLIVISFSNINVHADSLPQTKNVTASETLNIVDSSYAVAQKIALLYTRTYAYNDGTYSGTLNFSSYTVLQQNVISYSQGVAIVQAIVNVTYSGTVSLITNPPTPTNKTVTANQTVTITDDTTKINNDIQNLSSRTYNYDDGTYAGTLHYSSYSITEGPTVIYSGNGVTVVKYVLNVNYSGTVTLK